MTHMKVRYLGGMENECAHESGAKIVLAAPKAVGGSGAAFSPTDLLAVSLGGCMMTLMGIAAGKLGVKIEGAVFEIDKEMSTTPPRRIEKIVLRFRCSEMYTPQIREKLEAAALDCPVHRAIHPDVKIETDFVWGL